MPGMSQILGSNPLTQTMMNRGIPLGIQAQMTPSAMGFQPDLQAPPQIPLPNQSPTTAMGNLQPNQIQSIPQSPMPLPMVEQKPKGIYSGVVPNVESEAQSIIRILGERLHTITKIEKKSESTPQIESMPSIFTKEGVLARLRERGISGSFVEDKSLPELTDLYNTEISGRPLHQIALEQAVKSRDYERAKEIVNTMPNSDPYKPTMQHLFKSILGKKNEEPEVLNITGNPERIKERLELEKRWKKQGIESENLPSFKTQYKK